MIDKRVLLCIGILILLDCITGLVQSIKTNTYKSKVMREGLFHKVGIILVVTLSIIIEYSSQFIELNTNGNVFKAVSAYVAIMEIMSNLENINKINDKLLPSVFTKIFFKGDNENGSK